MKLLMYILPIILAVAMANHQHIHGKLDRRVNINMGLPTFRWMLHGGYHGGYHGGLFRGAGGAVYTRWGHNQCPAHSKLMYTGYAAGNRNNHGGGGADFLCLPTNPTLSTDRKKYSYSSPVYGVEYYLYGASTQNHDVPCAVCQSKYRLTSHMISGRDICPKGWHQEYKGLLMSGYYGNKAATLFVCVDGSMKTLPGSSAKKHESIFTPTTVACGSLACPPYKNGEKLTCTVCTN